MKLVIVSLLIFHLGLPAQAAALSCGQAFSLKAWTLSRVGGKEKAWQDFFKELESKESEQQQRMAEFLQKLPKESWFRQKLNAVLFFRINRLQNVLRTAAEKEITLSDKKSWNELSLEERRALLLKMHNRLWWEVESDYVASWSRYLKPSFLLTDALQSRNPETLDMRVSDLVQSPSNVKFWGNTIKSFARENDLLNQFQSSPVDKQTLIDILSHRKQRLQSNEVLHQRNRVGRYISKMEAFKTDYLIGSLKEGRPLSKKEVKDLADSHGVKPLGNLVSRLADISMSSLNTVASFVATMGLAYMTSLFFAQETEPEDSEPMDLSGQVSEKKWQPSVPDLVVDAIDLYNQGKIDAKELERRLNSQN
ncbi:MAG: hypothetical protein KDD33_03570 [Bdellovibrionales bacterium]|nr:hypothetical protein [Bdellovibrionales bacterium]